MNGAKERQAEFQRRRRELIARLPEPERGQAAPRRKITITMPPMVVEPDPPPRLCVLCQTEKSGWQFAADNHDFCFDCRRPSRHPFTWGTFENQSDLNRLNCAKEVISALAKGGKPPKPRGGRYRLVTSFGEPFE